MCMLGFALFAVPFAAVVAKAPWERMGDILRSANALDATRHSLLSATIAASIAAVIGMPIAWTLARSRARGVGLLRVVVLAGLVLPPTVAGVALFAAFGPDGLLEGALDAINVSLPGTLGATVLSQIFVAVPFYVVAAEAGFRGLDENLDLTARTLGAPAGFRFRSIVLPFAAPALLAGLVLAWGRALAEFGVSIAFPGAAGKQALPVEAISLGVEEAFAISVPIVAVSLVVIAIAALGLSLSRTRQQP